MRKDIVIPQAENIHIVAVKKWDEEFSEKLWNIYFVNNREKEVDTVLVMSRGNSEDKTTTTLRRDLGNIASKASVRIEFIQNEVLGFTNEYLVTFFAENKLFERKFIFEPNSISDENMIEIPVMENEGILAK